MNNKYKIKIIDTSLRDAQQFLWNKFLETEELNNFLPDLDECGFDALEVWGGGLFETTLKSLKEDPWKKLKIIKKNIKKTPLQMIIRGKNLVGYHTYSKEIIETFIMQSIGHGISILKIFDPMNDIGNIKNIINFSKNQNMKVEGSMCYTSSPGYDIDFYIKYAQDLKNAGVDSLSIKDASGLLDPETAINFIKSIKSKTKLPINLHLHVTNSISNITYSELIKNEIDSIDCNFAALSSYACQPYIENLLKLAKNDNSIFNLNIDQVNNVSKKLFDLFYRLEIPTGNFPINFQFIYDNELTRGSFTFLYEQLKKRNILNKFPKVLEEIALVRKDFGSPPLIIPISQIIIAQAVYNVLMEKRYKLIPKEVKDYVKGVYGEPINPISEELKEIIKKESSILDHNYNPEINYISSLKTIKKEISEDLIESDTDYTTYAIFPHIAMEYFKYRKNPNEYVKGEDEKKISTEEEILILNRMMHEKNVVEFELNSDDHYIMIKKFGETQDRSNYSTRQSHIDNSQNNNVSKNQILEEKEDIFKDAICSPIIGIFYDRPKPDATPYVKKGDVLEPGDTVCIIEAMKVMNEIKAPFKCKIIEILAKEKQSVDANQNLFLVEKL